MAKRFTKPLLTAPHAGTVEIRDTESPLMLRSQNGSKSFVVRVRIRGQANPVRLTWPGVVDIEELEAARDWARQMVKDCRSGIDPRKSRQDEAVRADGLRFEKIVEAYIKRRVRGEKKNRSADEIARAFDLYVIPRWNGRSILEIGRADVHALLDDIADGKIKRPEDGKFVGTPAVATNVLAQLRAMFNWYEGRDDKFTNPIVRGMARYRPPARSRVLCDEEIRALWAVLPGQGLFGTLVKTLLLTAQRRDEVGQMRRSEIDGDTWIIPKERYKTGNANTVPLTSAIQAMLETVDKIDNSDIVFTLDGKKPFNGYSKAKVQLDCAMLAELRKADSKAELRPWRLHDLRRTAKTIMAKAGVRPDISERVLGHVIGGVEAVYDRHDYFEQKRHGLEALGRMIEKIVNPDTDSVVSLHRAAS